MTSAAFGFLQLLALALGAGMLVSEKDVRQARRRASLYAGVILLWSLIGLGAAVHEPGSLQWRTPYPAVVAMVTFVAVSMSSLNNTRPSTYVAILALGTISTGALWADLGAHLVGLLLLQAGFTWWELRGKERSAARAFGLSQGSSVLLVGIGLMLGASSSAGFWTLALGIAVRHGCMPFHSWFLRFAERAPMGLVVAYSAPQVGLLVHMRLLSPVFPAQAVPYFCALGVTAALLGAVLGTVQTSLKRTTAYLLISQSGLVAFGLESASPVGHAGGLAFWLLVALTMTGFAMAGEALSARHVDLLALDRPGGDFESTPILVTSFLLSGLALVGLPGSLGFVAEDLLVQGSLSEFPVLALTLIVVTAINAFTVMRCVLTLFVGPRGGGPRSDLSPREKLAMSAVLVSLLTLGLFPNIVLSWFG